MKDQLRNLMIGLCLISTMGLFAQNDITLTLNLDRYGNETTWELMDLSNSNTIGSGGPYTQQASSGVYPEPPIPFANLADGDYRFSIFDSYGDGICCGFGNGSYELVEDATSNVVASGGSFAADDITDFSLPLPPPPVGEPSPLSITIEEWSDGPNGNGFNKPVDIAHANDGRIFIVEQDGVIWICDSLGQVNTVPFLNIDNIVNSSGNEQGLLGLAFHPDYDQNGYFYVNYTSPVGGGNGGTSHVSRFSVSADPDVADPNSEMIVYTVSQHSSNHNGGKVAFGPDGYLYIGFGDGGGANDSGNWAQNTGNALGKMIRIDVDGGSPYVVPLDNPFLNDPNTLDEIWAIGLRNPWRFSFDADSGDLWMGDVGQNAFEEIDFQPANSTGGENYGWRCYEGNSTFNTSGCGPSSDYVFPVTVHPLTGGWCAITGGFVYRGATFPLLTGHYIYTEYCTGQFYTLSDDGNGGFVRTNVLNAGQFGFASFGEDMYKEMYVANQSNGLIYKIMEPCSGSIPTISFDGFTLSSTPGTAYFWYLDGVLIPGATGQNYNPTISGDYHAVVDDGNGCLVESNIINVVATGIEENPIAGLRLVPNPALDHFSIVADRVNGAVSVQMTDVLGKEIWMKDLGKISGSMRNSFDVSNLDKGIYMVIINVNGSTTVERLLIR